MKMTRHGDYELLVRFPVWSEFQVHVVFTDDIGRSKNGRYGTNDIDVDHTNALHVFDLSGHSHLFYLIGNCPSGVVVHECWHAIRAMLEKWAGVDVMENETVAYHLGYLAQRVFDFRNDLIDAGIGVKSNKQQEEK